MQDIDKELSEFKVNPKMFVRTNSKALIDTYLIGKVLGEGNIFLIF